MEAKVFDFTHVKEITEYTVSGSQAYEMNKLLGSGDWILLGVASGVDEDGYPLHKYSLGRIK
ncbi:TPA: hypothetical protein ACPEVW_000767 [Proteus mirabilis]|uniref:hypothetical protein n=1 Tax=Proteus TaxID=583 RepID=UPI0006691050|nr:MULTISPECIES: hypothetical protein [Proteus]EKU0059960.1 hypothetical protein [Proteus mirabilis]ELA9904533.1 hypothetical protein [Proteus mirabilis]MBG2924312.1 hypothetical protein [Proteus mirabilis]MBI6493688.1 hypothetical protein [Proteus mirabilis]MBI6503476.1 hypothetical protein [Proteus mirabilis]